jgi:hypothetical protein
MLAWSTGRHGPRQGVEVAPVTSIWMSGVSGQVRIELNFMVSKRVFIVDVSPFSD